MNFRKADVGDLFPILQVFQKARPANIIPYQIFFDYRQLEQSIRSPKMLWYLLEDKSTLLAVISLEVDLDQRMGKINHLLIDSSLENRQTILKACIRKTLGELTDLKTLDLIYSTTLSLSLSDQQSTFDEGFKLLGIFPNILGNDDSGVNGLAAYYFDDALRSKRFPNFKIHPQVAPLFDIIKKECSLPDLDIEKREYPSQGAPKSIQCLELIRAEKFVLRRFEKLMTLQTEMNNFYPFRYPNCLITDPDQQIEIFLNVQEKLSFSAIIGERFQVNVDPVHLYNQVLKLLRDIKINYVEIINDASDSYGLECIMKSGFTPCAYFPALKKWGKLRRDFVILAKSYENIGPPEFGPGTDKIYGEYYEEYHRLSLRKS